MEAAERDNNSFSSHAVIVKKWNKMTFYHPGDKWRWQTDHFGGCEPLHSQNLGYIFFYPILPNVLFPPLPLRQIGPGIVLKGRIMSVFVAFRRNNYMTGMRNAYTAGSVTSWLNESRSFVSPQGLTVTGCGKWRPTRSQAVHCLGV